MPSAQRAPQRHLGAPTYVLQLRSEQQRLRSKQLWCTCPSAKPPCCLSAQSDSHLPARQYALGARRSKSRERLLTDDLLFAVRKATLACTFRAQPSIEHSLGRGPFILRNANDSPSLSAPSVQ